MDESEEARADYPTADDDSLVPHDSALLRSLLIAAGLVCVALGIIGLATPILPTTPFLIAAAACFARSSPKFYRWLIASPLLGPAVLEWRRHRSIPWRTRLWAIALMAASFGASIALFVRPGWLQALVGIAGLALAVTLYRIPSRDRP
jgi:uncharacterized protein